MKKFSLLLFIVLMLFPVKLLAEEETGKQEKSPWKSSVGLSYVTVSGNSESQTSSISGDIERKGENDKFELGAKAINGTSKGETISQYWESQAKYDHDITEKVYLFGKTKLQGNRLAGYNLRLATDPGAGFHIFKGTHELDCELSPGYFYEERLNDDNQSYVSGRTYGKYTFHITGNADFSQDAEYLHDFSDENNYRVNANTALVAKITELISLKTELSIQFVNRPPEGAKDTDVFTTTSFVFTF